MANTKLPEVWQRGPLPGIPALLQPVAHALLQAKDEVSAMMLDFPDHLLWEKPAGMASPGFHLQHLAGVLDRLFTYAEGNALSEEQLIALKKEGTPQDETTNSQSLVHAFQLQVDRSIEQLKKIDESTVTDVRTVGRAKLPSTVLGLLFHAAEHTMRHTGQMLVTVAVLRQQ